MSKKVRSEGRKNVLLLTVFVGHLSLITLYAEHPDVYRQSD